MKTLKDLGEKHYGDIHYSFDVYYYPHFDDMYVGNLTNIMEMQGYKIQLKAPTMEELVKKADRFLDMCKIVTVDKKAMSRVVREWNMDNPKELKENVELFNEMVDLRVTRNGNTDYRKISLEEYEVK